MFDGIWRIFGTPIETPGYAANVIANSNKKLGEKLEAIAKDEIKSKDRVDISLEEYERMRKRIETLERKNSQRDKLIIQLGIPAELIDCIDPYSVSVCYRDDQCTFKRDYYIRFSVDTSHDLWKERR